MMCPHSFCFLQATWWKGSKLSGASRKKQFWSSGHQCHYYQMAQRHHRLLYSSLWLHDPFKGTQINRQLHTQVNFKEMKENDCAEEEHGGHIKVVQKKTLMLFRCTNSSCVFNITDRWEVIFISLSHAHYMRTFPKTSWLDISNLLSNSFNRF